jgi:CHAT domain-containing protein
LIIVPDGVLGLIPFEALLSGVPKRLNNFGTYPYLLNDHTISYAYSATLRKEMAEKAHAQTPAKTVLAMAPFTEPNHVVKSEESQSKIAALEEEAREAGLPLDGSRKEMAYLKYSAEEAQVVRDIWDGDLLTGPAASLEQFVEVADQYDILHLSTHARADNRLGEHCFLAFPGDSLFVRDIYNLRLNADLVVLSACETGEGELLRGEGVISLARAFAYAGARSVVTSLWEVNDAATKEVMQRFHFYLHEGYENDEALRVAKRQFIKKNPGVLQHPYFWAGFVVVGE